MSHLSLHTRSLTVEAVAAAVAVAEAHAGTVDGSDTETINLVRAGVAAAEEVGNAVADRVLVQVRLGPEA